MIVLATALVLFGAFFRQLFYGSARAYGRFMGEMDKRKAVRRG